MTCEEARARLAQDELSEREEQSLSDHLESCPSCEAELERAQSGLDVLHAWQASEPASGLAQRTMEKLAEEAPSPSTWSRFWRSVDEALGRFASHRPTRITGFATLTVVMLLLVPILSPHWSRGRSTGSVSGCKVNQRLLAGALEEYAKAHSGEYPEKLADLKPDYVKRFPECPQAGQDTYSEGYQPSSDRHHFKLVCRGDHHHDAGLANDEPSISR